MSVDYRPTRGTYTELRPFRFWCQKILPLVYDDSLSYYELLCKVVDYLNKTMEDVETLEDDVTSMYEAYEELQSYVNNYFDNLDIQEEINNKLDEMAANGELSALISPLIPDIVTEWLNTHIDPTTPPIDETLSILHAAADAAVTGVNNHASLAYAIDDKVQIDKTNKTVTLKANSRFVWDGNICTVGDSDIIYTNSDIPASLTKVYVDSSTNTLTFKAYNATTPITRNLGLIGILIKGSFDYYSATMAMYPYDYNKLIATDELLIKAHVPADAAVTGVNNHASLAYATGNKIIIDKTNKTVTLKANSTFVWDGGVATSGNSDIIYTENDLPSSLTKVFINNQTNALEFMQYNTVTPITRGIGLIGYIRKGNFEFYSASMAMSPDNENQIISPLVNDITNKYCRYNWLSGTCFMCHCGKTLIIDNVGIRYYDNGTNTYTQTNYDTVELDGDYSARFIDYDGTNYSLSSVRTRNSVAFYFRQRGTVYSLVDHGIIPNTRKPLDGYVRQNSNFYINTDKYKLLDEDTVIGYSDNEVRYNKRSYKLTAGNKAIYKNDGKEIITFNVQANTEDITNKKILMIGDSFIARGYLQHYLSELEPTLNFVGSKTTQNYNYKSEGVSGSRLYYFLDPETSPFIYPDGTYGLSRYMSTYNVPRPDIVIINSAINHSTYENTDYGTYLEQLTTLVNIFYNYSQNIKIYVTHGANYAQTVGSTNGEPASRFSEVIRCTNSIYDASLKNKIKIIPIYQCLDDELDYTIAEYNYFGSTIKLLSDNVHPKFETGFRKMAEQIYNYLGI